MLILLKLLCLVPVLGLISLTLMKVVVATTADRCRILLISLLWELLIIIIPALLQHSKKLKLRPR